MTTDPQYAVQLLEELDEEFPAGIETMGHFERALYHLAIQVREFVIALNDDGGPSLTLT